VKVRGSGYPRAGHAALAFVLLTLTAQVILPVLVQQRVTELREAIATAEPARTLLARLQFVLVREVGALEDLLVSGGTEGGDVYDTARASEIAIVEELTPLISRLGPEVAEPYADARTLAARWHARVDELRTVQRGPGSEGARPRVTEPGLFEDVLRATAAVDSAVLRSTARGRARIVATERLGLRLTVTLGVLALLAAGAVAFLDERVHRFAAESARRREQAEAALAEAARADEARARLLRGVTHDVKNPLGAAKGYAELLAEGIRGPLSPEQVPLVEGIQRTIDSALAILTDLLDVARADGGLSVQRVSTDLVSVVRVAVEDHRAAAEAAGHALEFETTVERLPVHTDPARVRQVLDNLLSNAIKYTPAPGRVTVVTDVVSDGDAPHPGAWVVVRVTDTGPGIPPERRRAIFDEFIRLENGSGVGGHGLGLAIARRVARLLGGNLTVSDAPGPGATFVLWIPRRTDRAPREQHPPTSGPEAR